MTDHPNINKDVIASHYATRKKHDKRKGVRKFLNPPFDVHREAIQSLNLKGDEAILDAGCGDGEILLGLSKAHRGRLTGIDLNPGMFQETEKLQKQLNNENKVEFLEASVEDLPFGKESFDVLLAFFMLYHLPDLNKALSEFQRVLKNNGRLLVTAMGGKPPSNPNAKYRLDVSSVVVENVEEKISHFFQPVKKYIYEGVAEINDPESFAEALNSMRDFFVPAPTDEDWKKLLNAERARVEQKIKIDGVVKEKVLLGYFVFIKKQ